MSYNHFFVRLLFFVEEIASHFIHSLMLIRFLLLFTYNYSQLVFYTTIFLLKKTHCFDRFFSSFSWLYKFNPTFADVITKPYKSKIFEIKNSSQIKTKMTSCFLAHWEKRPRNQYFHESQVNLHSCCSLFIYLLYCKSFERA